MLACLADGRRFACTLLLTGEPLRQVRAVEILERIGTPAARQLLEELSTGAADARLTEEAKSAIKRLAAR